MDDLLKLDVQLLLLRYGRRKVLDMLATLGEQTGEQLELELELRTAQGRRTKRVRKKSSAVEVLPEISSPTPEVAEALRVLATRYENRMFLPQIRDVQRFLDRLGVAHKTLRSRRDAARRVMIALSKLTLDQLMQLTKLPESNSSDYADLAREIMGRRQ
jgi:hypothetical protein